jgi:hypothetical protein
LNIPNPENCSGEDAKPRIILAVKDVRRRDAYITAIGSSAELTLTDTIRDIPKLLRQAPCNGILVDIFLKVRASHMDKIRISDSLEAMPSATLNLDAKSGSIRILMLNNRHGAARSIAEFSALCSRFLPAAIYPDDLCPLHLNTVISTSPGFGEGTEKTFTMFISGSGCFLFTANPERYQSGSGVWIDLVGISDRKPIQGKVCWQCLWGVSHNVPGIYVEFESILECQYVEISTLMGSVREKGHFL